MKEWLSDVPSVAINEKRVKNEKMSSLLKQNAPSKEKGSAES